MSGYLGPNWNGWARFSSSYSEAVQRVINKRKKDDRKSIIKKIIGKISKKIKQKKL